MSSPRGDSSQPASTRRTGRKGNNGPPEPSEAEMIEKLYQEQREKERVEELEHENQTLKTIAKELRLRLDKHVQSQTQIIQHLKAKVVNRDNRITQLTQEGVRLKQENKDLMDNWESERQETKNMYENQIQKLEDRMKDLQDKFSDIERFVQVKEQLEADLKSLQGQLDEERLQHNLHVSALERRNVMEKDRLKNEMLRKIRETKLSLLAMTEDQLHTTTKRTIMENEQMTTELQYQSKETERIVRKNNKLVAENKAIKRQLKLDEDAKLLSAKRTHFFEKLTKKLNAKLKAVTAELEQIKQSTGLTAGGGGGGGRSKTLSSSGNDDAAQNGPQARRNEADKLLIRRLESRIEELEDLFRQAQADREDKEIELENTRKASHRMLQLQDEAVTFIMTCVEDINRKLSYNEIEGVDGPALTTNEDPNATPRMPQSVKELTLMDRAKVLDVLLARLQFLHPQQYHAQLNNQLHQMEEEQRRHGENGGNGDGKYNDIDGNKGNMPTAADLNMFSNRSADPNRLDLSTIKTRHSLSDDQLAIVNEIFYACDATPEEKVLYSDLMYMIRQGDTCLQLLALQQDKNANPLDTQAFDIGNLSPEDAYLKLFRGFETIDSQVYFNLKEWVEFVETCTMKSQL